jgi:heme exporter protein C
MRCGSEDVILDGVAGICILLALLLALGPASTEAAAGYLQCVSCYHTSAGWVAVLALFMGLVGGAMYLWRGEARFSDLLQASMEIGFTFVTVAILTGSVWAKPAWNTWWAWEPRLVTAVVLWLIYLAYFMLRSGIDDPGQSARSGAVYIILAFASVPFTFLVIYWWRDMPSVMGGSEPRVLVPLLVSMGAFTVLSFALLRHRMRLAWLGRQITLLREQLGGKEA